MNFEKLLLLKALDGTDDERDKNFCTILEKGVDASYFSVNSKFWAFVANHKKKYGNYPAKDTFIKKFGITDVVEVNEPILFYIDEISKVKRYNIMVHAMDEADKLFEKGNVDTGIARIKSALKHIDSTFKSVDLSIPGSVDDRMLRYEYRFNNPGVDGIPSGLPLLDNATFGWHGGELIVVHAYLGSYKCVDIDSFVRTVDGDIITLREFRDKGECNIHSFNEETGKMEISKVNAVVDTGIKEGFQLETSLGRQTVVSDIHPYLTDNGWVPLKDIKIGDRVALPRKMDFGLTMEVSYDKAYFLGLMLAEGSNTKGEAMFTSISPEIIQWGYGFAARNSLEMVSAGKYGFRFSSNPRWGSQGKNIAREWVKDFGLKGCKSEAKKIPKEALSWGLKSKAVMVKALFDGDGSVEKKGMGLNYTTISPMLAFGIVSVLLEFGIIAGCKKYKNFPYGGFYRITINPDECVKFNSVIPNLVSEKQSKLYLGGNKNSYTDTVDLPFFIIDTLDLGVSKFGRAKFLEVMGVTGFSYLRSRRQRIGKAILRRRVEFLFSQGCIEESVFKHVIFLVEKEIYMDKVVGIKSVGEVEMVDLSVEGTHNFVVQNTLVHNSWFLLYLARAAMKYGFKVLLATVEMGQYQIARRLDSILTNTEFEKLRSGCFSNLKELEEFRKSMQAIKGMSDCVIIGGVSFGELFLRAKIEEHSPAILLVDGIYLLEDDDKEKRKAQWEQLNSISRGLKLIAEDYNIPVIASTQAWKNSKKQGSKGDEEAGDVAFAGGIMQNADIGVSLGRIYDPIIETYTNRLWVKTTKLREGEPIKFKAEIDFTNMIISEEKSVSDIRTGREQHVPLKVEEELKEGVDFNVSGIDFKIDLDDTIPF